MTHWKYRDTEIRKILRRNDNPNNEMESVANTKAELIAHLKIAPHFEMLPQKVLTDMGATTTFHSFNRTLDRVWDFADQNLIWVEL